MDECRLRANECAACFDFFILEILFEHLRCFPCNQIEELQFPIFSVCSAFQQDARVKSRRSHVSDFESFVEFIGGLLSDFCPNVHTLRLQMCMLGMLDNEMWTGEFFRVLANVRGCGVVPTTPSKILKTLELDHAILTESSCYSFLHKLGIVSTEKLILNQCHCSAPVVVISKNQWNAFDESCVYKAHENEKQWHTNNVCFCSSEQCSLKANKISHKIGKSKTLIVIHSTVDDNKTNCVCSSTTFPLPNRYNEAIASIYATRCVSHIPFEFLVDRSLQDIHILYDGPGFLRLNHLAVHESRVFGFEQRSYTVDSYLRKQWQCLKRRSPDVLKKEFARYAEMPEEAFLDKNMWKRVYGIVPSFLNVQVSSVNAKRAFFAYAKLTIGHVISQEQ